MTRIPVKPELLKWACARAGDTAGDLYAKIPNLNDWIRGEKQPTLKQLEHFAKAAHVSLGYLFLPEPPVEKLPIPDMRTVGSHRIETPSPDLLDTIYACQMRQDWYRDYAKANREDRLPFLGTATLNTPVEVVAEEMQRVFDYSVDTRAACSNWEEALSLFINRVEGVGVLVMVNGVVGNSTNRPLNPDEFRGFALADDFASVIFINGNDTKAARVFTLAHELAHLWLGESAVSDSSVPFRQKNKTEIWCNKVAAEFLVPKAVLSRVAADEPMEDLGILAKTFKVSSLVILFRLLDSDLISQKQFEKTFASEMERFKAPRPKDGSGGGDFYRTLTKRVSKRFATALIASTLEGDTSIRDALRMLGGGNDHTFREYSARMGFIS